MTKEAEIAHLDRVIESFPRESYLGPWLREYRSSIVADIRNDFAPQAPMPSAAMRDGLTILENAKTERAAIIDKAHRDAERIKQDARDSAEKTRQYARQNLNAALAQI